jgi:acyl carrier protein
MGERERVTRTQIQSAVADLLTITLGRQVAQNESVSRDSESTWDSLKHVQLILMLEEQFGIQFSEEEMGSLRDSDGIVRAVEEKNAA